MVNALAIAGLMGMLCLCVGWLWARFRREGIQAGTAVLAACVLFYQLIPLLFLLFPAHRDTRNLFNVQLASLSQDEMVDAMLLASALVGLLMVVYGTQAGDGRLLFSLVPGKAAAPPPVRWSARSLQRCRRLADMLFLVGVTAMAACIYGAGGVRAYLSLGSLTRGLGKNVAKSISRAYLPMITLSSVILIPAYLYSFVLRASGRPRGGVALRFVGSFLLALLYLMYNQGRMPLLLFLLPFVMDWKPLRRFRTTGLLVLFAGCCLLLERLSSLFNYLSYGRWYDRFEESLLSVLLQEFTYPFANFACRRALVKEMGMRWGTDLLTWPAVVLPSSVDQLFGVEKADIVTIDGLLTETYSLVTGLKRQGGIPTDLFLFLYAQSGLPSLLLGLTVLGRLLAAWDRRFAPLQGNPAARLLILRVAMVGISCVNHFDIAVILRTRVDLVVLLCVLYAMTSGEGGRKR